MLFMLNNLCYLKYIIIKCHVIIFVTKSENVKRDNFEKVIILESLRFRKNTLYHETGIIIIT